MQSNSDAEYCMNAHQKITLIIQGSMVSPGMTGSGGWAIYSCYKNVEKILQRYGYCVDNFVLSIWDTEEFSYDHPKLHVVKSINPGLRSTLNGEKATSQFLQSYATYQALLFCERYLRQDIVIKIRTDQLVDVVGLINHMKVVDGAYDDYKKSNQSGYIYFPNALSWSPYSVGDFYIGGHFRDLLNFFEAQVHLASHSMSSAFSWVHSDIVFRYAYRYLRKEFNLPDFYYFPNIAPAFRHDLYPCPCRFKYSINTLVLWEKLLNHSICFFTEEIANSMFWRGAPINSEAHAKGSLYYSEWLKIRGNVLSWYRSNYPALYWSDTYKFGSFRYLNFTNEKLEELRTGTLNQFTRLKIAARIIIFLILLRFPVSNFALKAWIRFFVILKNKWLDKTQINS